MLITSMFRGEVWRAEKLQTWPETAYQNLKWLDPWSSLGREGGELELLYKSFLKRLFIK